MKKRQWMALLLGGCLLLGLAACKQSDSSTQEEDTSTSYAEDIQKKKDAQAAEQTKQDETKQEDTKQKEETPQPEEDASTKQDDTKQEDATDDANQDGEARYEISKSEAKASVIAQFGSADEDGQAYEYDLQSIEQIGSHTYYVYRMSWAADEQDGGAYSQTLKYIFVATDGSTIHTGTADEDGYDIDYSS